MFTILRPFGTRESIRQKADHHEGQIVLWYWQHATNLAKGEFIRRKVDHGGQIVTVVLAACHKLGQGDRVQSVDMYNIFLSIGRASVFVMPLFCTVFRSMDGDDGDFGYKPKTPTENTAVHEIFFPNLSQSKVKANQKNPILTLTLFPVLDIF